METKPIYFDSTGPTGNIFFILGKVQRVLMDLGKHEEASNVSGEVLSSHSYEEALAIMRKYVELIDTKRRV